MATASRLHVPAARAAAVNAALFALVPLAMLTYADYTSEVVRPVPPTLLSSATSAVRFLVLVPWWFPLAFLVGWRTYATRPPLLLAGYIAFYVNHSAQTDLKVSASIRIVMIGASIPAVPGGLHVTF